MTEEHPREEVPVAETNSPESVLRSDSWALACMRVVFTPAAVPAVRPRLLLDALDEHRRGNWVTPDGYDWLVWDNQQALVAGGEVSSVHRNERDEQFWVITRYSPTPPDHGETLVVMGFDLLLSDDDCDVLLSRGVIRGFNLVNRELRDIGHEDDE